MTQLMTSDEAVELGTKIVAAMSRGDADEVITLVHNGYAPTRPNVALMLRVLPALARVFLHDVMGIVDDGTIAVPRTTADAPEEDWWAARIAATAVNGDHETCDALVVALFRRAEQLPVDQEVVLEAHVLWTLTAFTSRIVRECALRNHGDD